MKKRKDTGTKLLAQYVDYFNRSRNAGIDCIGHTAIDPIARISVVRYKDGHEVKLDVLNWVGLFDTLDKLHPRHSDPPSPTKRATGPAKRRERAS